MKINNVEETIMRIGICDDDKKWREHAESVITKHLEKTSIEVEIVTFSGKEGILNYTGNPLDAVLMDIELGDDNGIEVASLINEKWTSCQIIYLTNYLFYATDVYNTYHVHYVLKEQFSKKVGEILGKIIHGMDQKKYRMIFSLIGGESISLVPEEILYFERDQRVTRIHTVWGEYRVWDKINVIMELLPEMDFVRCHNSYVVYLPAVKKMDKKNFLMNNGNSISISRGYSKMVEESFFNWAQTQM